jgi:hypothetical protein
VVDEWLWYLAAGFLGAVALMALGVEMARDIIRCRLMLNRLQERKGRMRNEEVVFGFLISDSAIELSKVICGLLNINPVEQKDEFRTLCDHCRLALENYEKKAANMHRRLGGK